MLATVKQESRPPAPRSGIVARYAIGGAWLFLLASLTQVAWAIAMTWSDPASLTTLYQTTVGGETYQAIGMTYTGFAGLVWALLQAAVVLTAAGMSVVPVARLRRLGHGVLVAWAMFWMLNLIRLTALDMQVDTVAQTLVMAIFLGCTIYRAVARPRPRHRLPDLVDEDGHLTRAHVRSSDSVREVPVNPVSQWLRRTAAQFRDALGRVATRARTGRDWLAPRVEPAVKGVKESARRIVSGPQAESETPPVESEEPAERPGRVHRFVAAVRSKLPWRSHTKAA
jgi:hypothetical protein